MLYRNLGKPIFFKMDPEKAHHLVIGGLNKGALVPGGSAAMRLMYGVPETADLAVDLFGLHFPTPVGLAAGLDKNAEAVGGFSSIGFGFMEVGTVTPKSQPGNDSPRLFRLLPDEALINRMGFNNEGAEAMAQRLKVLKKRRIPVAVNIGRNKVTPNESAHEDYRQCIRTLYPYGDFFVVNISSPNTPDLRSLQHGSELSNLLAQVKEEMELQREKSGMAKSLLVKIAPDVSDTELEYMVHTLSEAGVDGVIATNTTLNREGLKSDKAGETGASAANRCATVPQRLSAAFIARPAASCRLLVQAVFLPARMLTTKSGRVPAWLKFIQLSSMKDRRLTADCMPDLGSFCGGTDSVIS